MKIVEFKKQLSDLISIHQITYLDKGFGKYNFKSFETCVYSLGLKEEKDLEWLCDNYLSKKIINVCKLLSLKYEAIQPINTNRVKDDSIQELEKLTNIADVVSKFVTLKKVEQILQLVAHFTLRNQQVLQFLHQKTYTIVLVVELVEIVLSL
jgi:hypothetical protein